MNLFRLIASFCLFVFATACALFFPDLPFSLPVWVYVVATVYFAAFPIKDMIAAANRTLYKGRQYGKNFIPNPNLNREAFQGQVKRYNRRALGAMIFWLAFMSLPVALFLTKVIGRAWIFFFFALSNFAVFFALFFWCPFRALFIRPSCCNECRIYNWDSFFAYSFLIFIPNVFTVILFSLGVLSLIEWEVMHALHPQRFYKSSNLKIRCANCDLRACKNHKRHRGIKGCLDAKEGK